MIIYGTQSKCNNIDKNKLKEELKEYKQILNKSMIDYLNSLIELEFSIIRNYISDNEKELLSELDIYKDIANYNISQRILNLIKNQHSKFNILCKNNEDNLGIYADIEGSSIILYNFNYIGSDKEEVIDVGSISLYKTIDSISQREKEIKRLSSILEALYSEKNPYPQISNIYGGPSANWVFNHNNKIQLYENKLEKLGEKLELSDRDKLEIEITQIIHDLVLEDYDLTDDDFTTNKRFKGPSNEATELYKTYIKQIPKINIKNNIKYI